VTWCLRPLCLIIDEVGVSHLGRRVGDVNVYMAELNEGLYIAQKQMLTCDVEKFRQDVEREIAAGKDVKQLIEDRKALCQKRYEVCAICLEL
jgi:hypothetical protein